jgi:hypothetical protein
VAERPVVLPPGGSRRQLAQQLPSLLRDNLAWRRTSRRSSPGAARNEPSRPWRSPRISAFLGNQPAGRSKPASWLRRAGRRAGKPVSRAADDRPSQSATDQRSDSADLGRSVIRIASTPEPSLSAVPGNPLPGFGFGLKASDFLGVTARPDSPHVPLVPHFHGLGIDGDPLTRLPDHARQCAPQASRRPAIARIRTPVTRGVVMKVLRKARPINPSLTITRLPSGLGIPTSGANSPDPGAGWPSVGTTRPLAGTTGGLFVRPPTRRIPRAVLPE